jgi:autotransporter-associated beta strand protein
MKTNRTSTPATKTKSRNPGRILSASIAALLAVVAVPQGARAANVTWNHGSVVNNNWSNGGVIGNWLTSAAPANGDDVFFDNGAALNTANTNDIVGLSLNSITFNAGATNGTYTLSGNAITLGAGGLTNNTAAVTQTISLAGVTLGAGQTWNANAGNLAVTSTVNLNGQGLIVTGGSNTTISNAISGAGAGSTLTKEGTGILTVSGGAANTFAGLTSVNNGTLQLDNSGADQAIVGSLTIGDGVGAANSAVVQLLQSFEINDNAAVTINADGRFDLNGFNEDVGSIAGVAGSSINMGSGFLEAGQNNASTTFAGVISGGPGILRKQGTGTWTLTGANGHTGTTEVTAGILEAGNNTALGTTAGGTTVSNGATLRLLNGVNIGSEALGLVGAGVNAANGALAVAAGGTASYAGLITLGGSSTITANGGTLTLTGGIVKNGVTLTFGTSTSGGGTANVNSVISGAAASSDLVVESMTVNLGAANIYNGPTFIRSSGGVGLGILNANAAGALPDPLFGAPARSVLTMDDVGLGGSVLNLNGGFGQVVASLTGAASSVVNLNTSTLTIGTAAGTTTFAGAIHGLAGAGNVSIVKDGASTQVFSGPNTYLGLTNVNAGTLQLGNASALGNTGLGTNVASGATLDLNGQNIGVEAINISGIGTAAGIGALSNSNVVTTASLAGILTVVGTADVGGAGNTSLDGKVTGGVLTKNGAGTVFLTNNANDYVNTTITAGILQVGGATVGGGSTGVLGGGVVVNNATLNFNRNNALVVGNAISGSGAVNQNGNGITSLNGANSYNGATTVNAGTLRLGNATALGSTVGGTTMLAGATIDLNGQAVGAEAVGISGNGDAANLQIAALTNNGVATATLAGQVTLTAAATVGSNAGDISLDGGIAGAFGLTKVGTDTVFITNDSNTSTTTTISGGTLQVGGPAAGGTAAGALGSGAVTNNSILTFNRNNAINVVNVIGGTGVLNQIGSSAASVTTLSGANTYTGQTNVNAGTLQLGNATALGSALSGTVVASGATLDLNGQAVGGEAVAIAGTGVGGAGALTNTNAAGFASLAGTLTLTADASVGGTADNIRLDGPVTGAGLTKVGTNTVFLTNNGNNYTTTTISAGTLQVGNGGTSGVLGGGLVTNNATLNFNRTDTLDVSNVITGSGVVNQNGTGTTNLSGPNSYTGLTTVNAGVLEVQNNTALGTAAAGTTVVGGATLRIADGIVLGTETLTLTGNGTGAANALGALTVTAGGTATVGGQILISPSHATIHANGGTLNLNGGIIKTNVNLTLAGGGTINVNGAITGNAIGFNDDLIVNGTTSNLNAANTYLGQTFIRSAVVAGDGIVNANVANALPTAVGRSAVIMDDAGAGGSTLNIGGSTGFPAGASQSIASLVGTSTSKVTLGANKLTIGFGTGINTNGTANANFAGVISGAGSITKDDTSTQILSGLNTYTGETRVTGGTLRAGSTQAFGVDSATFVGTGAVLDLAGNSNSIGSLSDIGGVGGTVRSTVGAATLTTGGDNTSTSYAGLIENGTGPLTLVKTGTGTQSLSGNNTYTGDTFLDEGGLFANVAPGATTNSAFGTGTLHIAGGTTLGSTVGNETISNNINVNGDFSVSPVGNGASRLNMTGNVNVGFGNTITNVAGTGEVQMTGVTSGGSVTFAATGASGSFVLGDRHNLANPQNGSANTFFGPMTIESGAGVVLAKNNGVTALPGDATVNAGGTLVLFSGNQISDSSSITVNSNGGTAVGSNFGGFSLNGNNEKIGSLFGTGTVQLDNTPTGGASAGVLTVDSGNFSGAIFDNNLGGQLVKQSGGTLVLTGSNTFVGNTNVLDGTLHLNGSLRSASLIVHPNGTLQGFGQTSGNVVMGGTFRPGTTEGTVPGTFTIGGNYTQNPTGTLVIDIAGTHPSLHDQVVIGGTANLDGSLRLVRVGGAKLKVGDKITFLTASGGVNGEFSNVNNDFEIFDSILTADVIYRSNTVSLEIQQGSFGDFAKENCATPNSIAVGQALDRLVRNSKNHKIINFLNTESLSDLCRDFDLIAPEEFQAIYSIGISQANVQTANIARRLDDIRMGSVGFSSAGLNYSGKDGKEYSGRDPLYSASYLLPNGGVAGPRGKQGKEIKEMRPPTENRYGVFFTGFGEFSDLGSTRNASGYNLSAAGFTLGMDYRVNENFAIGVNLGYSRSNADLFGSGNVNVDGFKMGLYATYHNNGFYVDGSLQGGYNTYDTRRTSLRGSSTGSTDGTDFNALLGFGYDTRRGSLTFGPLASLQYTRVGFDSFREVGSLSPLNIDSQSAESLRSALGFKASYEFRAGTVVVRPEARVAWQHEFGDTAYGVQSSFANGGNTGFTVHGAEIGRDSMLLGAGLAVLWNERTSTYVYYDGEHFRENFDSNNVSGGVRVEF